MKRLLILLLLFLPLVACYGNNKIEEDNVFTCTSKSDCLDNFECRQGFCVEVKAATSAVPVCVDEDKDGYGGDGTTADAGYSKCTACTLSQNQSLCAESPKTKDCNDHDKAVYPGAYEFCDGKDNDCDGNIDNYLPVACSSPSDCGAPPSSDYRFLCKSSECVLQDLSKYTTVCDVQCNQSTHAYEPVNAGSCTPKP